MRYAKGERIKAAYEGCAQAEKGLVARAARPRLKPMSFREYRRRLPHWRQEDAAYFVTWRIARGQPLLSGEERSVVMETFHHFHGKRYKLYGCVAMDDHAHAVCRPLDGFELTQIVQTWKSYTGKAIQRGRNSTGPLWQEEYFDRIVRDEKELLEKLNYMHNNPYKRWPDLEEYAWMWLGEGGV